jgi:ubiquinol-cytochrome c reductase cytochrome c subunit
MKNAGRKCLALLAVVAAIFLLVSPRSGALLAAQESKNTGAPGNAEKGKLLFNKNGCYECHGREGQGSSMTGPRIAPNPPPFEVISGYVRKPAGEMPPYTAKVISDQELADIYAFLQSRPRPPAAKSNPLLK